MVSTIFRENHDILNLYPARAFSKSHKIHDLESVAILEERDYQR